jgi:hypothetical protein
MTPKKRVTMAMLRDLTDAERRLLNLELMRAGSRWAIFDSEVVRAKYREAEYRKAGVVEGIDSERLGKE